MAGAELDAAWNRLEAEAPEYPKYLSKTDRLIPVDPSYGTPRRIGELVTVDIDDDEIRLGRGNGPAEVWVELENVGTRPCLPSSHLTADPAVH